VTKLRVLSLFAGIGGFDLGLERTGGFETVAFCEIDPFCRRVLAKHWPKVACYEDVRELTAERLRADGIVPDVIAGGFPCQDISTAGSGAGIEGKRSGLWSEFARLIGELRPRFVIVENVSALLNRGIDRVLGDLATIRYDAEWDCIPAAAVGAPHIRDRVWIVAYPQHPHADSAGSHREGMHINRDAEPANEQVGLSEPLGEVLADPNVIGLRGRGHRSAIGETRANEGETPQRKRVRIDPQPGGKDVADAKRIGQPRSREYVHAGNQAADRKRQAGDAVDVGIGDIWRTEPNVGRVAHGVPSRVDRLRGLGNAVVPQIVEAIGKAIIQAEASAA
jgi:DNA (cytosine-5)-methyltransferase 1